MAVTHYYCDFTAAGGGDGSFGTPWNNSQDSYDGAVTVGGDAAYVHYRGNRTEDIGNALIAVDTNSGSVTGRIYHIADRFGEYWADTPGETLITTTGTPWTMYLVTQAYITFRGFEIIPYRHSIYLNYGSQADKYITLEELFIHDNQYTSGNDVLGIFAFYAGETIIRNNIIGDLTNSTHYCIGIVARYNQGAYIDNNTIYNITGGGSTWKGTGILLYHDNNAATRLDVECRNNIIKEISDWCILTITTGGTANLGFICDYNCFHPGAGNNVGRDLTNADNYLAIANWKTYDIFGDASYFPDINGQEIDPLLENIGGSNREDYKIRNTSPCKDAGKVLAEVTTDMYQRPRPAGSNDIGAFQYGVTKII